MFGVQAGGGGHIQSAACLYLFVVMHEEERADFSVILFCFDVREDCFCCSIILAGTPSFLLFCFDSGGAVRFVTYDQIEVDARHFLRLGDPIQRLIGGEHHL